MPAGFATPVEWSEADFAQVKATLSDAPFGKGTETVRDKSVRDALELNSSNSAFDNLPEWNAELHKAVAQAAAKLVPKLNASDITAEFYKMVRVQFCDPPAAPAFQVDFLETGCVRKGWPFCRAS